MGARRRTGRYVAYAFLCLLAAGLGGLLYRGVTAFMAGVERGRVVQGLDAVKDQRQAVRVACEVVLAYPDEARAHELLLRFTSPLGREPLLDPLKPLFERPGGEAAGGRGLRILAGRYWYGRGELTRTAAAYEPIAADPTLPVTDRRRLIRTWARVGQTGRAAAAVMALAPQAPKVRLDLLEALLASDAAADSPGWSPSRRPPPSRSTTRPSRPRRPRR